MFLKLRGRRASNRIIKIPLPRTLCFIVAATTFFIWFDNWGVPRLFNLPDGNDAIQLGTPWPVPI
jgi:hypothetical protein